MKNQSFYQRSLNAIQSSNNDSLNILIIFWIFAKDYPTQIHSTPCFTHSYLYGCDTLEKNT